MISYEAKDKPVTFDKIKNDYFEPKRDLLLDELKRLSPLANFYGPSRDICISVKVNNSVEIINGKILSDSLPAPTGQVKIFTLGEETSHPTEQDRFSKIMDVVMKNFGLDPNKPIIHDFEKVGSQKADRYLLEFQYKGEKISLIVVDWYGYAVYLTKSSDYNSSYNRRDLLANGARRFNWLSKTITNESLLKKMKEKLGQILDRTD